MASQPTGKWLQRYRGKGPEVFILLVSVLGAVASFLSLSTRHGLTEGGVAAAAVVFIFVIHHYLLGRRPGPIPDGKLLDKSSFFKRDSVKNQVKNGILESGKTKVCVVTGESGAGKSVLIRTFVQEELQRDNWNVVIWSAYDHLRVSLLDELSGIVRSEARLIATGKFDPEAGGKKGTIIIFDQAEQLSRAGATERTWMEQWIASLIKLEHLRCAFVVREDYYFNLRFLKTLLPCPYEVVEIHGVPNDPANSEYELMKLELEEVCDTEAAREILSDLAQDDRRRLQGPDAFAEMEILPLEAQMISFVLRQDSKKLGRCEVDRYQKLGRKAGVIREFFMLHVEACRNPEVAWAVLFALSTGSVVQRSISLRQLERVTYHSREEIKEVLDLFVDKGLIVGPADVYQWAHDKLWLHFREISAAEMEPALRDNLTYLAEKGKLGQRILPVSDEIFRFRDRVMLGTLVFVGLVLAAAALGFVLESGSAGLKGYRPLGAIAESLWALFLYRVRWLYIRIPKSPGAIAWWWVMPITGVVCVAGTWFRPSTWLVWIGVSALALGALLGTSRRRDLSRQSGRKFGDFGKNCLIFGLLVCLVLGFINVLLGDRFEAFGRSAFVLWSNYLGAVLGLVALMANVDGANLSVITMYLGFLDRTKSSPGDGTGVEPQYPGPKTPTIDAARV